MWDRGKFGTMITKNSTALYDPRAGTTDRNVPFDQEFYLILNVAVGGTVCITLIATYLRTFADGLQRRTATGQTKSVTSRGQMGVLPHPKSFGRPSNSGWIHGVKVTSAV
jgi:hypothetical protein